MTQSSENTKPESKAKKPASKPQAKGAPVTFSSLTGDDQPGMEEKKDEAKASLEDELRGEKERRVEERFAWIIVCVILVDVLWFRNAPNPVIPIVVLLLEAVILFIMAKRMGVKEASQLFERLIHDISRTGSK